MGRSFFEKAMGGVGEGLVAYGKMEHEDQLQRMRDEAELARQKALEALRHTNKIAETDYAMTKTKDRYVTKKEEGILFQVDTHTGQRTVLQGPSKPDMSRADSEREDWKAVGQMYKDFTDENGVLAPEGKEAINRYMASRPHMQGGKGPVETPDEMYVRLLNYEQNKDLPQEDIIKAVKAKHPKWKGPSGPMIEGSAIEERNAPSFEGLMAAAEGKEKEQEKKSKMDEARDSLDKIHNQLYEEAASKDELKKMFDQIKGIFPQLDSQGRTLAKRLMEQIVGNIRGM